MPDQCPIGSDASSSYREVISNFSMFQKFLATLISMAVFAGGCITLGIQIGQVEKLKSDVSGLSIAVKETNDLLRDFVQLGTQWTYENQYSQWEQSQSNFYKEPDSFWLAEPKHPNPNKK